MGGYAILFQLEGHGSRWLLTGGGRKQQRLAGIAKEAAGVLHGLCDDEFRVIANGKLV